MEDKDLDKTVEALKAWRKKPGALDASIKEWIEDEVKYGRNDPCEGKVVKEPRPE